MPPLRHMCSSDYNNKSEFVHSHTMYGYAVSDVGREGRGDQPQPKGLKRGNISAFPAFLDLGGAVGEASGLDSRADILHQALVIGEIVPR